MGILKDIGRYIRRQTFAIFWAVAILVGGLTSVALGTIIGAVMVVLFALFALLAPIIGLSIKGWIEELTTALDKASAKVKRASNVTEFRKTP